MSSGDSFHASYAFAFQRYVANPTELLRRAGYELGRQAVAEDLGVLELAAAHHDALRSALSRTSGLERPENVVTAAEEFFLESLAAFEMVRRGFDETREAAAGERRQAAIVRHLSSLLADTSLACDSSASLRETVQLVAEQARELTDAAVCVVTMAPDADDAEQLEVCTRGDPATWSSTSAWSGLDKIGSASAESGPGPAGGEATDHLRATLTSLDGRPLGRIQVAGKNGGREFSELDNAVVVHLAQMLAAAVERTRLHLRDRISPR